MFHGKEETRTVTTMNGRNKHTTRVKYCARHGWVDLTVCPVETWERFHGSCAGSPRPSGTGLALPVEIKKAA